MRIIKTAWATYTITGVNVAAHLLATRNTNFIIPERLAGTFGFVPASIAHIDFYTIPTLITSMFLHGDLLHLIGNMVFLLVFGRKVENQLERLNFIALYFATGITAAMTHALIAPDSHVPLVGASGAISGVLGAFFVYNPMARITLLLDPILIYFLRRITIRPPAWIFLAIWFYLQFSMGLKPHATNVAFWAHVGGFLAGALTAVAIYQYTPKAKSLQFPS